MKEKIKIFGNINCLCDNWYPALYWGIQYNNISDLSDDVYKNIYMNIVKSDEVNSGIEIYSSDLPYFEVYIESRFTENGEVNIIINFVLVAYYNLNELDLDVNNEMKQNLNRLKDFLKGKPCSAGWCLGLVYRR